MRELSDRPAPRDASLAEGATSDPAGARPSGSVLKTLLKLVLALLVSAGALFWAFQGVDLEYVRANLPKTTAGAIAVYVLAQLVIHAVRIVRYWLLVEPLGRTEGARVPSWRSIFAAMSVGIPASVFLPLRLGEIVRPLMISRAGLPLPAALASVVVERLVDALFNVGLFFVLLGLLPASAAIPGELRTGAFGMLAVFGGGLVFLIAAYFQRGPVLGLFERLVGRFAPGLARRLVGLITTFLDGLAVLGSPGRGLTFLALTAAYWGLNGYSTYVLAQSYGLDIPVMAGSFAISCVVFAVAVPAGPAFAGTMEIGFRLGLAPFGVSSSDSAVVAIVAHVVQLAFLAGLAGAGLAAAESTQRAAAVPARAALGATGEGTGDAS